MDSLYHNILQTRQSMRNQCHGIITVKEVYPDTRTCVYEFGYVPIDYNKMSDLVRDKHLAYYMENNKSYCVWFK